MGPQTAVVVGASGEEIYPDKYGRIKVQFYWDRVGKKNDNSSCWIRVSQFWAGKQWGAIFIPRVGQEVVVDFLEGDPDQPLITGSVYNAEQMPPYTLPDNKTQSGILTRSSPNGSSDNYNQIRFEDKKGSEQINIHAEKDMIQEVENNDSLTVGNDQTINIKQNRTESVGKDESITIANNRTESVGKDESITIANNRTESVGNGESINIQSNRTENVGGNESVVIGGKRSHQVTGDESLEITTGNQTTNVDAGSISTSAMQGITLTCGASSIQITPSGVTISAPMVTVSADGVCQISADGMLQAQGSVTMINS
jgi:type VI secretion system secreted protein VgrG